MAIHLTPRVAALLQEVLTRRTAALPLDQLDWPTLRHVRKLRALIQEERFGYLWELGVDPEQQGRGLSRQVLQAARTEMVRRGLPACYLRTEDQHNVAVYERLGFCLVREVTSPETKQQAWFLRSSLAEDGRS